MSTMKGTSEFDPIKAIGEEIAGLFNVQVTLLSEVRQAEMRAAEAAQHYDNMVKLKQFLDAELARKRKVQYQLLADRDSNG